ncbi:hypothetical protein THAOC_07902 [Thalassiosira oceanica]|uniref:Uncharacterized protein n=1 Tax=Thalassiosira oceanica TaxID=159749 RepID=K0SZ99_THAOC|nr:hypothetical protein THAOC_07902 [Thalassiosira oceanica]|eukprot:EJK70720.1 hypothetical protein THAOC_07902 [Thalassiosira oceanica]
MPDCTTTPIPWYAFDPRRASRSEAEASPKYRDVSKCVKKFHPTTSDSCLNDSLAISVGIKSRGREILRCIGVNESSKLLDKRLVSLRSLASRVVVWRRGGVTGECPGRRLLALPLWRCGRLRVRLQRLFLFGSRPREEDLQHPVTYVDC